MEQWTEIRFHRGFREFCEAWRNNAAAFISPGEEMKIEYGYVKTNMPIKHVRRFLRHCAPNVRVTFFETERD